MADKVARLAIEREAGFLYFVRNGDVWRIPRAPAAADRARPVKVATGAPSDDRFLLFLDRDGDVARVALSGE